MIYFETDYVVVKWDEVSRSAVIAWSKFASSEQFRLAMNKLIELLTLKQTGQILADTRQQGVISLEDQDWTNKDWYPRAVKAGYKRIAIVLPHNVITQMSINRVMQTAHPEVEESYFEKIEEATTWLATKSRQTYKKA